MDFPVNFCFLVPDKKGAEFEHQTGGVACMHHKIKGWIIDIPLLASEERLLNKLFMKIDMHSQNHVPYSRVVTRAISYLDLSVSPVEYSKEGIKRCIVEWASPDVSHEAWQWVAVNGGCKRCPELEEVKGKRILMIYPNSD